MKRRRSLAEPKDSRTPILRPDWPIGLATATLVVLGHVLFVASRLGFIHGADAVLETDHLRYLAMAGGQASYARDVLAHQPPFCYRVLTPWLAFLLSRAGLSLNAAFYLLSQTFLVLFLFTLYLYLRSFRLPPPYAALGVLVVGLLPGAVRWYVYQYWMSDPPMLFFITLAFLLIRSRSEAPLSALSTIALTARETYLLVFTYHFLHHRRRDGFVPALRRTGALVVVPLVILFLLRHFILAAPSGPTLNLARKIVAWRWQNLFPTQIYLCTIGSLGVLVPLLLLLPGRAWSWMRRAEVLAVLAMVYASLALADNTDRLLAYALPVIVPPALANLRRFVRVTRIPVGACFGALALCQLHLCAQTKLFGDFGISVVQPFSGAVTASMTLLWLGGTGLLLRRGRARAGMSP